MNKVIDINAKRVKSTWLQHKLKKFPKCGVRFGTEEDGHGFVIISPSLNVNCEKTIQMIVDKTEAAKIKSTKAISRFIVPPKLARAAGL
jgi:hypothetical protein